MLVLGHEAFLALLARKHRHGRCRDAWPGAPPERPTSKSCLCADGVYGRVMHVLQDLSQQDADGNRILRTKVSRQDVARWWGFTRNGQPRNEALEASGVLIKQEDGSFCSRADSRWVEPGASGPKSEVPN